MSQTVEIASEHSAHRFLAECSDKRPSAQHLRPNFQPIYHHPDETRDLRARAYGDRALIVLVRVTPHQGGREGRPQGEAVQVVAFSQGRARDVRSLN
jgi:hypothetical protein